MLTVIFVTNSILQIYLIIHKKYYRDVPHTLYQRYMCLFNVTQFITYVTLNKNHHLQVAYNPIMLPVKPPAVAVDK